MDSDLDGTVRATLARSVPGAPDPGAIEPDLDMAEAYGLTSLNKVLFMTSVCEATGVDLSNFTEQDLARMRTLRDVTEALAPLRPGGSP